MHHNISEIRAHISNCKESAPIDGIKIQMPTIKSSRDPEKNKTSPAMNIPKELGERFVFIEVEDEEEEEEEELLSRNSSGTNESPISDLR